MRDWTSVIELIPDLRAATALPAEQIDALELIAHRELLTLPLPSGSLDILKRAWSAVPKALRRHPALVATYARQLLRQGEPAAAESVLRRAIDQEWDEQLVEIYGQALADDTAEQLEMAEGWLHAHPDSPALLFTLGRLALQQNLTSKAQTYLEKSIALRGPAAAGLALGDLFERIGEPQRAREMYRRALEKTAGEQHPAHTAALSYETPLGRQHAVS